MAGPIDQADAGYDLGKPTEVVVHMIAPAALSTGVPTWPLFAAAAAEVIKLGLGVTVDRNDDGLIELVGF